MIMIKKALTRAISGFFYSIGINVVIVAILMTVVTKPGFVPAHPEFVAKFSSELEAIITQCILIGLTSAAFGGWSVILEMERISLLLQSILYFIVTAMVWIPVAIYCWDFGENLSTFISIITSYLISYAVTWMIQYRLCQRNIEAINRKIEQLRSEENNK